jgi:hypothetical protein
MKTVMTLFSFLFLMAIGSALAPELEARNNTCTVKAIKDVNLQAYFSDGGRKSPSIRNKSEVIWSGDMRRGEVQSMSTRNGWIHLTYQDLTDRDPRSENNDMICKNNRVILVPR